MQVFKALFSTTTQLFSSPLNCTLEPGTTYFSAFPEDAIFGAIHNSMKYRWSGACQANPEYEPADMLAAMQRAIQSAHASQGPFWLLLHPNPPTMERLPIPPPQRPREPSCAAADHHRQGQIQVRQRQRGHL